MVHSLADYEQQPQRVTIPGEMADTYHRTYNIPPDASHLIPAEGDDLPGETCDAVLGPYIVRGGVKYRLGGDGSIVIQVTARKLNVRSGSELKGRTIAKTADDVVYHTRWAFASATSSAMPKVGDVLSDPDYGHSNNATCISVSPIDTHSEPGRAIVRAVYAAPLTYSEAYS